MFVCTVLLFLILYESILSKYLQLDGTVMKIVCLQLQHVRCLIVLSCIAVIFCFLTVFGSITGASTTQFSLSPSELSQMGKSVARIVSICVYMCMSVCMFCLRVQSLVAVRIYVHVALCVSIMYCK